MSCAHSRTNTTVKTRCLAIDPPSSTILSAIAVPMDTQAVAWREQAYRYYRALKDKNICNEVIPLSTLK